MGSNHSEEGLEDYAQRSTCQFCGEAVSQPCANTRDMEDTTVPRCKAALAKHGGGERGTASIKADHSRAYFAGGSTNATDGQPITWTVGDNTVGDNASEWVQYGSTHYVIGSRVPGNVTIHDVAWAMAHTNRFCGHAKSSVTVAKHSVFVSKLLDMDAEEALYGLLHDVHETVFTDIVRPVKRYLGEELLRTLQQLEDAADEALFSCFGVAWPMPSHVKLRVSRADNIALATERRDLLPPCDREWGNLPYPPHHSRLQASNACDDYFAFLHRYNELAYHLGLDTVPLRQPSWHVGKNKNILADDAEDDDAEDDEVPKPAKHKPAKREPTKTSWMR